MSEALNILVVEGSADVAQRLGDLLRDAAVASHVVVEPTLERAEAVLAAGSIDVVLLDLDLTDGSGLPALARVQLAAGTTPIVVLVEADATMGLKAVQAGAAEYLELQTLHPTLLRRALAHAAERGRTGRRVELQAQLLEQVGEAVIAVDNAGLIVFWNRAAEALYGWHADEVAGQPLSRIIPVSPELESASTAWADGEGAAPWSGELHARRKDGSTILVSITVTPRRDSSGAGIGRVGVSSDVTDRRAAEAALRENEQRLRLFVEAMPTILWTTDVDQRITSITGAGIARMRGSAERALGRRIADYAPELHTGPSQRALEGEAVSTELEWGGHTFDLHIEPLRAAGGEIIGTIGIALDVTERRRSEQEAAQYFELLRIMVAAAPLAIIVVDEADRVSLWNRAAERMFGWAGTDVVGRPVPHMPAAARALFERFRSRAADAVAEKVLTTRITKDGRTLDVEVIMTPITGLDGRYHGTMSILEDVTHRRLAEERQERLTAIIEASPDFVATFDAERNTLYVNRAGRQLMGLEPGQSLEGTTLEQFCTGATATLIDEEALPQALKEGTWTGEGTLRALDGAEIAVWMTLVAHRGTDDVLKFISLGAHDISARRMLEDQLRQSQKMEAVGRLAGGVAHDFNNLLTAIAGHAELLLADLGASEQSRSDLEEVLGAVDRASALTRQLLAFSRRQILQPRLLDLNHVVSDIGRLLRRLIGEDVNLITRLADDAPHVRGDRGQLEQVIMNLVVNARDALPVGGTVTITTTAAHIAEDAAEVQRGVVPGSYVELAVGDNGVGMDELLLTRIFEPFFTTKEQGKGTGLGLPTVYGIVTQSGGHVLVDSEPGAGSTFRVLLPAAQEERNEGAEEHRSAPARHGSETVLLVEDEVAVRRLGCRILERRGYTVIEADSGVGAIEVFERMAPAIALLVTDVVMPGMSGVELARRLRLMKPSLRVLYTSGYTADEIHRHGGLDAGTGFLEKPFTPDALAKKVQDVLDGEV